MDRPDPTSGPSESNLLQTSRTLIVRARDEAAEARGRTGRSREILAQSMERIRRLNGMPGVSYEPAPTAQAPKRRRPPRRRGRS
jgi:hypothetical protein